MFNPEWDEVCILGHCGTPSGCERDGACRANCAGLAQAECCGNPLRGCAECPPPKKLTFEEWMYSLGWAYVNAPLTEEDLKTIWKTAQESK